MQAFKTIGSVVLLALTVWSMLATVAPNLFAVTSMTPPIAWVWIVLPITVGWILYLLWSIDRRVYRLEYPVRVEQLEATLRKWADGFGASIKTVRNPNVHFGFEVKLETGHIMAISQKRKIDRDIVAAVNVSLSEAQSRWFGGLDLDAQRRILYAIQVGILGMSIEYHQLRLPLNEPITVSARAPISGLNEDRFRRLLMEVVRAQVLIVATLNAHGQPPEIAGRL